jgi:hypothetical protein
MRCVLLRTCLLFVCALPHFGVVTAPPWAEWLADIPVDTCRHLPAGITVNEDVMSGIVQHFGMSLVQSAVIDKYWSGDFSPILNLLPQISTEQRAIYTKRWNFKDSCQGYAPHYLRTFIACPLYREDASR